MIRPFATDASRFQLAVSAGFVTAAVGFLVVGVGTRFGSADSIWGAMTLPGTDGAARQAPPSYADSSSQYASRQGLRIHVNRSKLARRRTNGLVHQASDGGSVNLAGRSVCVRLCDGFVFPVGDYHGSGDRVPHEAMCQSQCPGAKTSLFVLPSGADSIGDAIEIKSGRSYGDLPDAFHYATYLQDSCSCGAHGGSDRVKALLRDFTLRRGDTVMTAKGMRVFHGGTGFPFTRKAFATLQKSRDIGKSARADLKAMERASLTAPITVGPPAVTASSAPPIRTRRLVHQARN